MPPKQSKNLKSIEKNNTVNKIIIIAAPSGSGKTSIVNGLLAGSKQLSFSVSATTRAPRGSEINGIDYYFISVDEFQKLIKEDAFIEWEMVYEGKYYGTLKSEIERIEKTEQVPILDIDVVGATKLKQKYPDQIHAVFIQAPSLEELKNRLQKRGTDSEEIITERLEKAAYEATFAAQFDTVIINDVLEEAINEAKELLTSIFPHKRLFNE